MCWLFKKMERLEKNFNAFSHSLSNSNNDSAACDEQKTELSYKCEKVEHWARNCHSNGFAQWYPASGK